MEEKLPDNKELSTGEILHLYAGAFDYISDYAYLIDKDCRLINCNQAFINLLGIERLEETGVGAVYRLMQAAKMISADQMKILKQKDIQCLLDGENQITEQEIPFYNRDQAIMHFKSARYPVKDPQGTVLGLLVVFTDPSELAYLQDQVNKLRLELQGQNQQANKGFKQAFPDQERQKPIRVLLVEDNQVAQKAAKAVLMNCDCLVEIAKGEAELKQQFKPGSFDLIFMDLGLEGTTGYVLAKYIRNLEKESGQQVPIIALTGFDADAVRFDCEYYQMQGAISKPLQPEQVQQIIQKFIRHIDLQVTGLKQ